MFQRENSIIIRTIFHFYFFVAPHLILIHKNVIM